MPFAMDKLKEEEKVEIQTHGISIKRICFN